MISGVLPLLFWIAEFHRSVPESGRVTTFPEKGTARILSVSDNRIGLYSWRLLEGEIGLVQIDFR